MTLDQLNVGDKAKVTGYCRDNPQVLRRILEMGLIRGAEVEVARFSPMGDPMEITVKGYLLSVRLSEAALIEIDSY
jgi:ferrous iron transport protein A